MGLLQPVGGSDRARRIEAIKLLIVGSCAVVLSGSACVRGDTGTGAASLTAGTPGAMPVTSGTGPLVSDVRIVRLRNDVSGVHWALTFDADVRQGPSPAALRCRWHVENQEGERVALGTVELTSSVEDEVAGLIYPDEVPGQPVEGDVAC